MASVGVSATRLKVPDKPPGTGRLGLDDGSCVRPRPERPIHVRSHDVVESRTDDGRAVRILDLIDEFTQEWPAISVGRTLGPTDAIDVLADRFILRAALAPIGSDNGPEFIATAVRRWIAAVGVRPGYRAPGLPWDGGRSDESPGDRCPDDGPRGERRFEAPRPAVGRQDPR